MGQTVAALQSMGHVGSEPDLADQRQMLLSVTATARAWVGAGRAARRDWLTRVIDCEISPSERAELGRALVLLKRISSA